MDPRCLAPAPCPWRTRSAKVETPDPFGVEESSRRRTFGYGYLIGLAMGSEGVSALGAGGAPATEPASADAITEAPAATEALESAPTDTLVARPVEGVDTPTPRAELLPAEAAPNARLLARVGGAYILESDLEEAIHTPDLELTLDSLVSIYADEHHLPPRGVEEIPEFYERILDELPEPAREQLRGEWNQVVDTALDRALVDMVDQMALRQWTSSDDGDPWSLRTRAAQQIGEELGAHSESTEVQNELNARLDAELYRAIWAPHERAFVRATEGWSDDDRAVLRDHLTSLYAEEHGLRAAWVIAGQLESGGDARGLTELIASTGALQWTAGEVAGAAMRPELAGFRDRLLATAGAEDVWLDGDRTLIVRAENGRIVAELSAERDPARERLVQRIRSGDFRPVWVAQEGGPRLVLAGSGELSEDEARVAPGLVDDIARELNRRAAEIVPRVWTTPELVPESERALLFSSPAGRLAGRRAIYEATRRDISQEAEDELGPAVVESRLRAGQSLEVDTPTGEELTGFLSRVRLLLRATDGATLAHAVEVPLDAGVPLGREPREALALAQNLAIHAGVLAADTDLGVMDEATAGLLEEFRSGEHQARITPEGLRDFTVALAEEGRFREVILGELIATHPILRHAQSEGAELDPVHLVNAYMNEQGVSERTLARPDAEFLAALTESRALPFDPELARRAMNRASVLPPTSEAMLRNFLAARATGSHGRPPVVEIAVPSATSREEMRRRLEVLASPAVERSFDPTDLPELARFEPVAGLRLALAQVMDRAPPIDGAGVVESVLTADELRELAGLVADRLTPQERAWFSEVAGEVERGERVIHSFGRTEDEGGRAEAFVSRTLRQMAENVRVSTAPYVPGPRPSGARSDLREALEFIRGETIPIPLLARVRARDIDRLVEITDRLNRDIVALESVATQMTEHAAVARAREFVATVDAQRDRLIALRAELEGEHVELLVREGRLVPPERASDIDAAELEATLFEAARVARALEAARAVAPSERTARVLGRLTETLQRPILPTDTVVPNAVDDWRVLEVALESGADPASIDPSAISIDGAFIRHVLEHHADALGRPIFQTVLQGFPSELPGPQRARELLQRVSEEMDAGVREPWETLNVTLADLDADDRSAKLVSQAALRAVSGAEGPGPSREMAVANEILDRVVQAHRSLPSQLNARMVQAGFLPLNLETLRQTEYQAESLGALLAFARRSIESLDAGSELRASLEHAESALAAASALGRSVAFDDLEDPEASAALALLAEVGGAAGSSGAMSTFDFAAMLGDRQRLLVRRPLSEGDQALDELDWRGLVARVGQRARTRDDIADGLESWSESAQFRWDRAAETTGAAFAMVRQFGVTLLRGDLYVAPGAATSQRAAVEARTDDPMVLERAQQQQEEAFTAAAEAAGGVVGTFNPAAYVADVINDLSSGQLDIALGKGLAYAPVVVGSGLLIAGAAREALRRAETGARIGAEQAGILPRQERLRVVAVGTERVYSESLEEARRGSRPGRMLAHTGSRLIQASGHVLNPVSWVREPARAIASSTNLAMRSMGVGRYVRIDPNNTGSVRLPASVGEWAARTSEGSLRLQVFDRTRSRVLTVPNLLFHEVRDSGRIPTDAANRLGLTSAELRRLSPALQSIARQIPAAWPAVIQPLPSLRELSERPAQRREWVIQRDGRKVRVTLQNLELLRFIDASGNPARFERELRRFSMSGHGEAVRAVVAPYAHLPRGEIGHQRRVAGLLSTGQRGLNLASGARRNPSVVGSADFSVTRTPEAALGDGEEGDRAGLRARERALSVLEERLRSTELSEEARASLLAQVDEHRRALGEPGQGSSRAERAQRAWLRARCATIRLEEELRSQGFRQVAARITRARLNDLSQEFRGTGFYVVVAVAGQQFLVDLGETLNDESLDTIDSAAEIAKDSAVLAGTIAGGAAAFSVLNRVAPRVAQFAGRAGLASLLLGAESLIEASADALGGYANPLDAMHYWRDLGIPEAGFLKIDPDRFEQPWLGYDPSNDIATMRAGNSGSHPTARGHYWYFNPESELHQRLRRLFPNEERTPVRRPSLPELAALESYREPVHRTVTFVERVPEFVEAGLLPEELLADATVDFESFEADARERARSIVMRAEVEDGEDFFSINARELRRMLARYERFGALDPQQREMLVERNEEILAQSERWSFVVSRMGISAEQKQEALTQMVVNAASNVYANYLLYRAVHSHAARPPPLIRPLDAVNEIDDFYTHAFGFVDADGADF